MTANIPNSARRTEPGVTVVTLGELLIDLVPAGSATPGRAAGPSAAAWPTDADRFLRAAGGAPANVAMALAKLGRRSALVGAVGDDPFGRFLLAELRTAGVYSGAVATVPQLTALAVVTLSEEGDREFVFYRENAAHDHLAPTHVDAAFAGQALAGAAIVHLGSNLFATEPAAAASWRALELASQRGLLVSFDVNYRAAFWPTEEAAREDIERLLPRADIVKLSADELLFLRGSASRAAAASFAEELLTTGARLVCVTLGAAGTWYFCAAGDGAVPAPAVTAVDTTGAGDAFMAAVLAAADADPSTWSDAEATRLALQRACAYAALSTTSPGAGPSYLTLDEFERRCETAASE